MNKERYKRFTFPYDGPMRKCSVTGAQLRRVFSHIMRPENRKGDGECYQVSRGVAAAYSDGQHALQSLSIAGAPVVSTSQTDVIEEYLRGYQNVNSQVEGRLVYLP